MHWTWQTNIHLDTNLAANGERTALLVLTGGVWPVEAAAAAPEAAEAFKQDSSDGRFSGKLEETRLYLLYGSGRPYQLVIAAGTTRRNTSPADAIRLAAAAATRAAVQEQATHVAVLIAEDAQPPELSAVEAAYAATEGIVLASYQPETFKRGSARASKVLVSTITLPGGDDLQLAAMREAHLAADAVNYARDLTNAPGNKLTPANLAEEARSLASRYGLDCSVLERPELERIGMGGLLAVGQGSVNEPCMIVLRYQGCESWGGEKITGLVGKGITFDTGGISIKPASGMEEMISDMGGAAVLLATVAAVAERKLPVNLVCVIPAAENMPSGNAYKPGDMIRSYSGRTIEVLNTDAEGRIVLADGITYAKELGASRIIDVATLTGSVLVALADIATAAVGNDDDLQRRMLQAAEAAGERLWPLPAYPEFWEKLESKTADVKNATSPDKWGAVITAGLFIGTFAEETPWLHLDTGGTAWLWSARGVDPVGGTGAMTRTLLRFLASEA